MAYEELQVHETPASVLDIVSFGFKTAIKKIVPIAKLSSPVLLCGVFSGLCHAYQLGLDQRNHAQLQMVIMAGVISLLSIIPTSYIYYVVARYVNAVYFEQTEDRSLFSYWIPGQDLMATLIYSLVFLGAIIPISVIGIIGIVLLVIPGIAWFSLAFTLSNLVFVSTISNPQKGVFKSISESFSLIKGNVMRTILLGIVSWLVYSIIVFPLSFLNSSLAIFSRFSPSFVHSAGFYILSAAVSALLSWLSVILVLGGILFLSLRYLSDLRARRNLMNTY